MEWLTNPEIWAALVTLTALEIVLGIDNIIILSILVGKLPPEQRERARVVGLAAAGMMRIGLLLSLTWMMRLVEPLFTVYGEAISGRDLILIGGGLFLIAKSTHEIHSHVEGGGEDEAGTRKALAGGFTSVIIQIMLIDIVFSLDSVITAIGLAEDIWVMVVAILIAVTVMLFASRAVSVFVDRHPTLKMLALSFLVLIGVALIADGLELHIPKAYIYFAMAFSVLVEMLNMRHRTRQGDSGSAKG